MLQDGNGRAETTGSPDRGLGREVGVVLVKPRFWRPRSLKALLVYLTLAIIGPAALASASLIAWNVGEAKKAREEQLLNSAQMVSAAVDLRIAQMSTTAQAIAGADALRADDWPGLRRRIERFDLGDRSWVAVSDATGRRLLNTFPGPQAAPAGLPRPASVQDAVRTGRPVVSDLFWGSASGRSVVSVDAPVEDDPSGKVVTLVLEAVALRDLLAHFPTTAGVMMITLVDRRHRVVARTRDHEAFVGVPATAQMRAALRKASSGVTPSVSLDGDPTVVAFHRSALTGWTAMVVVPRSELTGPILANAAVLSAGVLAVLLLALFGATALGGVLTREMRRLEDDAVRLGHGEAIGIRDGPVTQVNTVQGALSLASVELRRREDRQTLMIHELNHRVKNTLATIQALAVQSFRGGGEDAPARFDKRLQAYASAHDLLTQVEWKEVDMRDVARRCLDQGDGGRIHASGPDFRLQPHEALALCMCLHELATNSMKYGALSALAGQVSLTWERLDDAGLGLEWRETGGPPVSPPTREGFGTRLMQRLARTELGGELDRDYAPTGLVVTGRFTLSGGARWRSDFDA